MTKSDIIDVIFEKTGIQKTTVVQILDEMNTVILDSLKKGESVKIAGLGTFFVKKRNSRKGRNPKTGVIVDIPEKNIPKFKVSKTLKDSI